MRTLKLPALAALALATTFGTSLSAIDQSFTGGRAGFVLGAKNLQNKYAGNTQTTFKETSDTWISISGFVLGLNAGYVHDLGGFGLGADLTLNMPFIDGYTQGKSTSETDYTKITDKFGMQLSVLAGGTVGNSFAFVRLGYSMNSVEFSEKGLSAKPTEVTKQTINANAMHWGIGIDSKMHDNVILTVEALQDIPATVTIKDTKGGLIKDEKYKFASGTFRIGVKAHI